MFVAILGSSVLSSAVLGSRIAMKNIQRHRNGGNHTNPMGEEYSHPMGANLHAECQPSIPEEPCSSVPGSALKSWFGSGYCECLHGEKMLRRQQNSEVCATQEKGGSWFWASEASANVDCTCAGYGSRTCEPQVSVEVQGNDKQSNLKCMRNHVCKIDLGYFCTPVAGSQASASDCNYPHAGCGPISHRCVARLAMIKEGYLNNEASKENALPAVRQAVTDLGTTSLEGDTFDVEGWDNALASSCETAGLTKFCYA